MESERYIEALRKSWVLIVVLASVGALVAFIWSSSQPAVYKTRSAVFFQVSGAENTSSLLQGSNFAQNQIRSYAALATKEIVLKPVAELPEVDTNAGSLTKSIKVSVPLDTAIVEITASAGTPEGAETLANAVAKELGSRVESMSSSAKPGQSAPPVTVDAQVVQQAGVPGKPVSPTPGRDAMLGLLLGLSLGVMLALGREFLNNRVTDEETLSRVAAIPLLGRIPWSGRKAKAQSVPTRNRAQLEAFRRAAANFEFVNHSGDVKAVVITSAQPGEGKTSISSNLAAVLSSTKRVLLIDCDLRNPSLAGRFGLESAAGLTSVITGRARLEDVVQAAGKQLHVLTSGPTPPNPLALIASQSFADLLVEARQRYDAVIIDAPPLLPVTDAALLARVADGAIIVIGSRRSTRKQVARAISHLSLAEATIHGAVITMLKTPPSEQGYYGTPTPTTTAATDVKKKAEPRKPRTLVGSASRNGAH